MSIEPEQDISSRKSYAEHSLDMTGLPASVADELRRLVAALRDSLATAPGRPTSAAEESADQWARRLQAWIDTHPAREVAIDDSRENLYAGRGK